MRRGGGEEKINGPHPLTVYFSARYEGGGENE